MRRLFAALVLFSLGGCTYTVEIPDDDGSGGAASPAVTTAPAVDPHAGLGMDPHAGMGMTMPRGPAVEPSRTVGLSGGLKLKAPEAWLPKSPTSSIIQSELAVPAVEGDDADGRVTVMAAGGSVEANVDRWIGQFTQPDGSDTKQIAKVETIEVAGLPVHLVDISGTYRDARGMMGPVVERPGYRMLAAIIETPEANWFVKFYGPEKTVTKSAEAFRAMIEGLGQ